MTASSVIKLPEGKYAINIDALKVDADERSVMANYLSEVAIVTKQADSIYVSVMFKEQHIVTGFQIENEAGESIEAIDRQVNEDTNSRFEMFTLDDLRSTMTAHVQYEVEHEGQTIKGDEALRLFFDRDSIENADDHV